MSRDVDISIDTPIDLLAETISSFKDKDLVRYDERSNIALLNICKREINSYHKDVVSDLRYLKRIIMLNDLIKKFNKDPKLRDAYIQSREVMTFEKDQFTRLKTLLNADLVKVNDGAYCYCVCLGLIKSHINTNVFIADKKEEALSQEEFFGYIPGEETQLTSDNFKNVITNAIDDLEEKGTNRKCK